MKGFSHCLLQLSLFFFLLNGRNKAHRFSPILSGVDFFDVGEMKSLKRQREKYNEGKRRRKDIFNYTRKHSRYRFTISSSHSPLFSIN